MIVFDTWSVYVNSALLLIYFLKERLLTCHIFRLKCFIGNWGSWEATLFTYNQSICQLPFPMTLLTGEIKLYSGKSVILFHFKCWTALKVINYFFSIYVWMKSLLIQVGLSFQKIKISLQSTFWMSISIKFQGCKYV